MSTLDFDAINEAAAADRLGLLRKWFPNGRLNGHEFEVGDLQGNPGKSLKINVKTGAWSDFNTGESGGDMISLYAAIHNLKQGEAARELAQELGVADDPAPSRRKSAGAKRTGKSGKTTWTPVTPAPEGAPKPTFRHNRHGAASTVWKYHDAEGRLLGCICRFDKPNARKSGGGKEVLPYTLCRSNDGHTMWRWLGFSKPRPLYGLDALAANGSANVIIVEGEKAADAGRRLAPGCVVITWPGGSKAIKHVDWSPLKGRKVLIIPDADEPGLAAAEGSIDTYGVLKPGIAQMLNSIAAGVRVVDPPEGAADGWDMADALEEGWTPEQTRAFIKERMREARAPESQDAHPEPQDTEPPPPDLDDYGVEGRTAGPVANAGYYAVLGYNSGSYYFMTSRGRQVVVGCDRALSRKSFLLQLAPLQYWEREFPSDKGFTGQAVDRAANALFNACFKAGLFSLDRLRGRGAWWDDGRSVLHLGDKLVVNGAITDLTKIKGRFIYEEAPAVRCALENPLSTKEAHQLQELCESLLWNTPVHATLLAGWCVVAPICGALPWRPHIWITSSAGGGKSWVMDNIVHRCLGETSLKVQSLTSEAGIRQTLGCDARPVVFDEAESENRRASANMEGILGLMTQASCDGGHIVKGSISGQAKRFTIRSCFAFASINVGFDAQAQASRLAVLTLIKDHSPEAQKHFTETIKPMASRVLTQEYCTRLQARAVRYLPVIRRNAEVFGEAAAEHLGDRRLGDLLGAMLAGAYLLHSTKEITLPDARVWVQRRDWAEQADVASVSDEMNLLATIMDSTLRVDVGSGGSLTKSVGELVDIVLTGFPQNSGERVDPDVAHKHLKRSGVRVDENTVSIANTHVGIKRILHDTQWGKNWNRSLLRIEGAAPTKGTIFFSGGSHRAVKIPSSILFQENRRLL